MFEWLAGYQKLEQEIYYMDWELEVTKSELDRWENPNDLGRYSLVKDSKASKLEEHVEIKEYELAHKMNNMYDLRKLVYSFKGLDQTILRMRYFEGLTLKEIAHELGHGYTYIKKRHATLVKTIGAKKCALGYQEGTNYLEKS